METRRGRENAVLARERRYAKCSSEDELLGVLGDAIAECAEMLVSPLRPLPRGRVARRLMGALFPASSERRREIESRLLAEAVVFVARKLREHLRSSSFHEADLVHRRVVLRAGEAVADREGLGPGPTSAFCSHVSHVLLRHAHFPPEDDDAAMVRLVAAREEKLTMSQAVRFVTCLVGTDPVRHAAPTAFVDRWVDLREEAWPEAAQA